MKTQLLYIILLISIATMSCQDITVGFLDTEKAEYIPDTMTVRRTLDPKLDATRIKNGNPWISTSIQGVEGTAQIFVSIKAIMTDTGDADRMRKYLKVYGDGAFELPLEHDIPVGRYLISLHFQNEGYAKDKDNCFTIIVEE